MIENKLLNIRLQLGYKFQKDFAEFLGMNVSHYNRIEKNKIQPEYEKMLEICEKLKSKIPTIRVEDVFYKAEE